MSSRKILLVVLMAGVLITLWVKGYNSGQQVYEIYKPPVFMKTLQLSPGTKPAWVNSAQGRLYVSYFDSDRVDILNMSGEKIGGFNATLKPGTGIPQGMGLIGQRLLVADYYHRALVFFSPQGEYIESYAKLPNLEEFVPVGVAVYNRVFYVTNQQTRGWMAVGDDGQLINVTKGTQEKDSLRFPYGIAVTADGRVIVTDPAAGKIKVYVCAGWYIYDLPTREVGLKSPQGIAIDGFNRIHIVDNGSNQVFVYDIKGYFLFKYGRDLLSPANISIDRESGLIFITNTGKSCITVWAY